MLISRHVFGWNINDAKLPSFVVIVLCHNNKNNTNDIV